MKTPVEKADGRQWPAMVKDLVVGVHTVVLVIIMITVMGESAHARIIQTMDVRILFGIRRTQ